MSISLNYYLKSNGSKEEADDVNMVLLSRMAVIFIIERKKSEKDVMVSS